MSGSVRRRHSKWDHKKSEDLPETLQDRGPLRRHREPSPNRGLREHDSRSKERVVTWDRERNSSRMSPGLDEWSNQHRSRSPRNDWGRLYRSSRSRSRSQSPAHHLRREPVLDDRSRSRSGVYRDFAVGRCRRGNHCQFLHQNDQSYARRWPLECSPPDDWEGRHQKTGVSGYSPLESKDYDPRTDNSMNVCEEFLKGKCRRGTSCRYVHHETVADAFEKEPIDDFRRDMFRERERDRDGDGDRDRDTDNDHRARDTTSHRNYDREHVFKTVPVDDVYRDRDNDFRSRDTYRNHDREPQKRRETFCKFFASGNCRSGNHCRFFHEVQERSSPERRSQNNRRRTDHKLEAGQVWDGPRWSDGSPVSKVPPLQVWEEEKVEVTVVSEQVAAANSADDLWSHGRLVVKDSWTAPPTDAEIQTQNGNSSLQWKTENNVLGMGLSSSGGAEIISDHREASFRDIKHGLSSSHLEKSCFGNISCAPGQQDAVGDTVYENPFSGGFQDQKLYNEAFTVQNSNHKEDKPAWYHGEGRNISVNNDGSSILQSPTMNTATYQGFSQNQQSFNEHTSGIHPAGQTQVSLQPSEGGRIEQSHVPSILINSSAADGPHLMTAASSGHSSAIAISPAGQGQTQFLLQPSEGGKMQESLGRSIFLSTTAADRPHLMNATSSGHTSAIAISPAVQGQTQYPFQPFEEGRMQESHNPSIFVNTTAADRPHLMNATSSGHASDIAAGLGNVSSEQLVQLSHLSASLAQLLESRQQLPQVSSNITRPDMSKLPDAVSSVPPASSSVIIPDQAPELPERQYDPICDSIEPKVHNSGGLMLPSDVEQKSANDVLKNEGDIVDQLEPVATSKVDENMEKAVEGSSKAPENKPSEDMPVEDAADDVNKSKDTKAIRPFKLHWPSL